MNDLARALAAAGRSLGQPTVLLVLFVPMIAALLLWLGIAVVWWGTWASMIQAAIVQHGNFSGTANWDLAAVASWIATATILALLLPMITSPRC